MSNTPPPCRFHHALLVYNPTAGARRRHRLETVLEGLGRLRCRVTLSATTRPGDAEAVAAKAREAGHDLIIAAGGDGTVNEIANGLVAAGSPLPLAFLPLGTANVLAAEIGLKSDPGAFLTMIAKGRTRTIRLGIADGRHFVLMASAGLDSVVVQGINLTLKRRAGRLAYGYEALRRAFTYSFPEITVQSEEGSAHRARMVVACRARCYGGPFQAAPRADLASDRFQLVLLEKGGVAALLRYGAALALGRLPLMPDVRVLEVGGATITAEESLPVQADGDLVGALPLTISMSPASLELVVP